MSESAFGVEHTISKAFRMPGAGTGARMAPKTAKSGLASGMAAGQKARGALNGQLKAVGGAMKANPGKTALGAAGGIGIGSAGVAAAKDNNKFRPKF